MRLQRFLLLVTMAGCAVAVNAQRQYWGISLAAGADTTDPLRQSALFRVDSTAMNLETLMVFDALVVGQPTGIGIIQAANGTIYGMTNDLGFGQISTLYAYDPVTDSLRVLVTFGTPQYPWNGVADLGSPSLIEAQPGILFGKTDPTPQGTVFKFYTANDSIALVAPVPIINYQGTLYPGAIHGDLTMASDGYLYAAVENTTPYLGRIARIDPVTNTWTTPFAYSDPSLGYPQNGSFIERNGKLYSNTFRGGPGENGLAIPGRSVVMEYDPATNIYTKLLDYSDSIRNASKAFIEADDGLFYGVATAADTTGSSFNQWQVLYHYDPQDTSLTLRYDLPSADLYGVTGKAWWGLLPASNGMIYGSFENGLFEYDPVSDTLRLRAGIQYTSNGAIIGHGPSASLIEICRKPNYKPRSTTSFSLCTGSYFAYDLQNVNAAPNGVVWRRNGIIVPGQTSQRLEFAATTAADAGVWACTLTNQCGVTEPPAITLTVNAGAGVTSTITGDTLLCGNGDSAVLSGNNGGTWSTGATTPTITVTQPGNYQVWNQNACGLTFSNILEVMHLDSASTQLIADGQTSFVFCPGASVVITGNDAGPWGLLPTGQWQDGSTASTYTVQDTGTYFVTASNACNADTSNILYVYYPVPPTPVALFEDAFGQVADGLLCAGDSVLVYSLSDAGNSVFLNGQYAGGMTSGISFVASTSGTYQMVAYFCGVLSSDTSTFTITLDSLPPSSAVIMPDTAYLFGCDQDTAYLSSADPYCYWAWQDINNVQQTDSAQQILVDWNIGNNGFYTLYNYNGCGTGQPDFIQVQGTPAPDVLYAESLDTLCLSAGVLVLSAGTPLGGTYTGNGVSGSNFDPVVAGIGAHTITYTYSDGTCTGYAQDVIMVDACMGIAVVEVVNGIVISPNPNTGLFTLNVFRDFKAGTMVLYDAKGTRVGGTTRIVPGANEVHESHLAPGVYQVRIEIDGAVEQRRVVITEE